MVLAYGISYSEFFVNSGFQFPMRSIIGKDFLSFCKPSSFFFFPLLCKNFIFSHNFTCQVSGQCLVVFWGGVVSLFEVLCTKSSPMCIS